MALFGKKKPDVTKQMDAFNSMKESLSEAVYNEVGKKLVEESKIQMEKIETGINEKLIEWEKQVENFIQKKIEEEIHKKETDLNDEI